MATELKVVFLGKEGVGKTSVCQRIHGRPFKKDYEATVGGSFTARQLTRKDRDIKLAVWDTSGSRRYEYMNRVFYRSAKAAIVCYDLIDLDSWERAKEWMRELRSQEWDCKVYICGTKLDLVQKNKYLRQLDSTKAQEYASGVLAAYFETSSVTGENIDELMERILDDFTSNPNNFERSENVVLHKGTKPYQSCCFSCCPACSLG